jgi:SAM-dependent methyltransferase
VKAVGFEYSQAHAKTLSSEIGIDVLADLDELERRFPEAFDVITLHFVVEHLTDFKGTIKRLARLLKRGGIIRYVVPNIRSWEYRMFGRAWHGLDPPRHVIFPTREHAIRVARDVGLEFCDERSARFPNGFGGSVPTALLKTFNAGVFAILLPIALTVTWLFPAGNVTYSLRRCLTRSS